MHASTTSWVSTLANRLIRFRGAAVGLGLLLPLAACSNSAVVEERGAGRTAISTSVDAAVLASLFDTVQDGSRDFSVEVATLLEGDLVLADTDPAWPVMIYLKGEAHRQAGQTDAARGAFARLASWAVSDSTQGPYGDTLGGSGLAVIGLWRWLEAVRDEGPRDAEELDLLFEVASQLRETRFYSGMIETGLLPAVPLWDEEVADMLAQVAWANGRVQEATQFYLDFLAIDSRGERDSIDSEILAHILDQGLATRERLELFRARRQLRLVLPRAGKDVAAESLRRLYDSRDVPMDVRAEAGYEWANYMRQRAGATDLIAVLNDVLGMAPDESLAERALYLRGFIRSTVDSFRNDMERVLKKFPQGSLADDALNRLAWNELYSGDIDRSLEYFRQLRHFPRTHDFQDSAYFFPALALIGRNQAGDLDVADQLLDEYVQRYPDGVFRRRSIFWRGRIAERRSDLAEARRVFQSLIEEVPYDYYSLRSAMHIERGTAAIMQSLPSVDSSLGRRLNEAYAVSRSQPVAPLSGTSPYHERLRLTASAGLYGRVVEIDQDLGARLDNIPLEQLDDRGLVSGAAVLLSLRQDAVAARNSDPSVDNWFQLIRFMTSNAVRDWPMTVELTTGGGEDARRRLTELQKELPYLATMYPDLETLSMLRQPMAQAAWSIDGSTGLSQSLMYAVIRQESGFYVAAISHVGALGLFQFMPATFAGLDRRWNLLTDSPVASAFDYLVDPGRNIALWARWVNTEFPIRNRNEIFSAFMKHQAGSRNVSDWNLYWRAVGLEKDVEYQVETARFAETRNFLRRVLTYTAIVDAAGLFENPGN